MADPIADAIAQMEAADKAANTAQLAFAVGRFDEYWQAQVKAAEESLKALYEQHASGGNSGPDGDVGTGDSGGGEGGGVAGPPTDAEGTRAEG